VIPELRTLSEQRPLRATFNSIVRARSASTGDYPGLPPRVLLLPFCFPVVEELLQSDIGQRVLEE